MPLAVPAKRPQPTAADGPNNVSSFEFRMSSLATAYDSKLETFPMRLDLFLKSSRLCPRRTAAQELCAAGAVKVNSLPAKSSRTISVGDEITLRRGDRLLTVRVLMVPTTRQTSRSEAYTLYQILAETPSAPEFF